jgi:hypothetical protein
LKIKPLLGLAIASVLFIGPVSASPVRRVSADVAQGYSGQGLRVSLAPAHLVSINFGGTREKIVSVTAADRSRFVFVVSGSSIIMRRIKTLNMPGEYSGGNETTLLVLTVSSDGAKSYPITVVFTDRNPGYSVVEIQGGGVDSPIPVQRAEPVQRIPLVTSQRAEPEQQIAVPPMPIPTNDTGKQIALSPPPIELKQKDKAKPSAQEKPKAVVKEEDQPNADIQQEKPKADIQKPKEKVKEQKPKAEKKRITAKAKKLKARPIVQKTEVIATRPAPSPVQTYQQILWVDPPKSVAVSMPAPTQKSMSLNNHQMANALVIALMSKKISNTDYYRGQSAIRLLRQGKTLDAVAKRTGLPIQKLKILINAGTKKRA